MYTVCVGCTGATSVCKPTHRHTHKQILRWNSTYAEQGFNSFFIVFVNRTSSTLHDKKEKKGWGGHKPSEEEHAPFEVAFLLGTSFGITRLVKQIIKCNGFGGLWSFISDGKNKVLDDLGDSGAGFDGNSHACWYCLLVLTDRCYHPSRDKELLTQLYWDMKYTGIFFDRLHQEVTPLLLISESKIRRLITCLNKNNWNNGKSFKWLIAWASSMLSM